MLEAPVVVVTGGGGGGGGGGGAGCVVGVVVGVDVDAGGGELPGAAAAGAAVGAAAGAPAAGVAGAAAPEAVERDEADCVDVLATEAVPEAEVPELVGGEPGVAAAAWDPEGAPPCSALSCDWVDAIDECNCVMPAFSRAISAATAAAWAVLPVVVGGAVFTE